MIAMVAAIAVIAVVLVPLLLRDLRRAVERQRWRAWMRRNPHMAGMRKALVRMQVQVRDHLTPALAAAARRMDELAAALRRDER